MLLLSCAAVSILGSLLLNTLLNGVRHGWNQLQAEEEHRREHISE